MRYYSLSSQIIAERKSYYEILEQTQKRSCEVTSWLVWFLEFYARAIERSGQVMNGAWSKAHF